MAIGATERLTGCVVRATWAASLGGSIRTAIAALLIAACSSAPHSHVRPVRDWDVAPPVDMSDLMEVSRPDPLMCPQEFEGDIMDRQGIYDEWQACLVLEGEQSPRCHCMGIWVNGPPP